MAVRQLKRHASWVQNVVRQFGLYLSWAHEICVALTLVREDRVGLTSGLPVSLPVSLYFFTSCLPYSGDYSTEVPPLPIPNREVKLSHADGTA